MKNKMVIWLGLTIVFCLLTVACSGSGNTPDVETESVASDSIEMSTVTPTVIKEEPTPTEKVSTQTPTASPAIETVEPTLTERAATEELTPAGPRSGDIAPDFTLPDGDGSMVNLADELQDHQSVVLVFYLEYG